MADVGGAETLADFLKGSSDVRENFREVSQALGLFCGSKGDETHPAGSTRFEIASWSLGEALGCPDTRPQCGVGPQTNTPSTSSSSDGALVDRNQVPGLVGFQSGPVPPEIAPMALASARSSAPGFELRAGGPMRGYRFSATISPQPLYNNTHSPVSYLEPSSLNKLMARRETQPIAREIGIGFWPFLLSLVFVIKVIFFVGPYAGIEHDSGWYLGIAKNLADRGIYASYTNTIESDGVGAFPSIHHRYSVQDKDGYSYLPGGITVGPGYVIPEAILLRIFGNGWWQYRLWPLLSFAFLLIASFALSLRLGGRLVTACAVIWLWSIPQFTTQFAFEALSEQTALFYLILSFVLCAYALTTSTKKRNICWLAAGVLFALAVLTKLLLLLAGVSFFVLAILDLFSNAENKRSWFTRWSLLFLGFLIPNILFELYQFLVLYSRFGMEGYVAIWKDFFIHFQQDTKGGQSSLALHFLLQKADVWRLIGFRWPIFAWFGLGVGASFLPKDRYPFRRNFLVLSYVTIAITMLWFIKSDPAGWGRHAWHALYIGLFLLSGIFVEGIRFFLFHPNPRMKWLSLLLVVFVAVGFRTGFFDFSAFLDEGTVAKWRELRIDGELQGLPSNPIVTLWHQQEVVEFFKRVIRSEDQIYYWDQFLVAEISPLVDRVFYPLGRYVSRQKSANRGDGKNYVIFGPYQIGPNAMISSETVVNAMNHMCAKMRLSNPEYVVCELKPLTPQP